jgi:hypothetical protein
MPVRQRQEIQEVLRRMSAFVIADLPKNFPTGASPR